MNKTQRIFISPENKDTDKHIKVKLEHSVKTIEFLTMSIDTSDVYQSFNADYGVLVGRVIANNSIGIPNAKISIFIALSDSDSTDANVYSLYPYTTPRDVNNDGKRYNLLPRVGKISSDGTIKPPQPFGSFPIKEEIVVNEEFLNVYKKYYKYTATTNFAGDYMIFGVPIGTQTVHMSVDITDIGKYSMNPASMIKSLGYSENLFINQTIIKPSNDLNDLPHIETQEVGVDIIPFWGDAANFEIGITRQDFKIRSILRNTFTIFASAFTDGDKSLWGDDASGARHIYELYRAIDDANTTVSIDSKRIGKITEKIYYYPPEISDADIDNGNVKDDGSDMLLLDSSEYSFYKRNGDFVAIVNCNRNKVITNEFGEEISVSYDTNGGVFTKFRGFLTLEITENDIPMNFGSAFGTNTAVSPFRYILKFPQYADRGKTFMRPNPNNDVEDVNTIAWRKQSYSFKANSFYTLSKFHGTTFLNDSYDDNELSTVNGFIDKEIINSPYGRDPFWDVGIIVTDNMDNNLENTTHQFPNNTQVSGNLAGFGANWLNMSIYLPQLGYAYKGYSYIRNIRSSDNFTWQFVAGSGGPDDKGNNYYFEDNTQDIAANQKNTKWFARSDLNWTDIVEVSKDDIFTIKKITKKGFSSNDSDAKTKDLVSQLSLDKYRNGIILPPNWTAPCPINGGKINGNSSNATDTATYFYKGLKESDCIEYLFDLGIIN